jgi:hypothetical protein
MRREAKGERRVRRREMESQRQTRERGGHKGFLVGTEGRSGAELGRDEKRGDELAIWFLFVALANTIRRQKIFSGIH